MQGFNHIAGGITFTGIFASFHDVNVFEKPEYLGVTVVFALLPDIDHTRSIIGKTVYPLARWLSIKFGHRTITHSLVFYLAVLLLVRAVELLYLNTSVFSVLAAYSLLSHNIFDMCTRQGIPFFYPFSTRPCVLPANPNMRLRTSDLRSEAVIFVLFCSMMLFCMPLFTNGFWMQYNKSFLNYDHIQRESKRKGDLLEITFVDIQKDTVKAVLINQTETVFVVSPLTPSGGTKGFKAFDVKDCKFLAFRHTGKPFVFKQVQVFGIGVDSVKAWLKLPLLKMQLQCNQDMKYFEGAVMKTGKSIEKEFIQGFDFFVEKPDKSKEMLEIETLSMRLASERSDYSQEINQIENEISDVNNELAQGESNYSRLSDFQKGRWQSKKKELENDFNRLEREHDRKKSPNLQADEKRLEALRLSLESEKVLVSGNFWVWER
ncbi:MAG: metal-dependent hydrolase [Emticicia sp.]|nr:metal-dependent hydrolase [Emticicia sp.]